MLPRGWLMNELMEAGIPCTPCCFEGIRGLCTGLPRLLAFIRRTRPAMIHAHLNRAALWSGIAARTASLPSVATLHGLTLSRYYLLCDRLVAVSETTAEHFRRRRPSLGDRIRVIPNGVPYTAIHPSETAERRIRAREALGVGNRFVIGAIGSLHPNKGHEILVQAVAMLTPAAKERIEVLVVGDGRCRPGLEALIAELGLSGRCALYESAAGLAFNRGVDPAEHMPNLYSCLDMVVVPSYTEAFSLVCVEAMSLGVPVVASNSTALKENIRHGETGWLFDTGDPRALASLIERLMASPSLLKETAGRARKFAVRRFPLERMAAEYLDFYDELLERNEKARRKS